jgi:hypothetical protein
MTRRGWMRDSSCTGRWRGARLYPSHAAWTYLLQQLASARIYRSRQRICSWPVDEPCRCQFRRSPTIDSRCESYCPGDPSLPLQQQVVPGQGPAYLPLVRPGSDPRSASPDRSAGQPVFPTDSLPLPRPSLPMGREPADMNAFTMLGFSALTRLLVLLIAAAASLPAMHQIHSDIQPPNKEPSP